MKKIFIDGAEGTTGLKIFERFKDRTDIEILKIDSELRKDENEIRKFELALNSQDKRIIEKERGKLKEFLDGWENEI